MRTRVFNAFATLLSTLLVLVALPTQSAKAATLCVAPGGGEGCYATLQSAVTAASSGDTIMVSPGTYNELNIVINKSVTILGDPGDANPGPGVNAPIIDGGSAPGDAFLLENGTSNVTIRGFVIRNFTSNDTGVGNGISAWEASTSNITIQDNYFHDLGWNAVLVGNDGAKGDHTNWLIKANILERWAAYGFELTNASFSSIEDNIITSDTTYNPDISILVTSRRNESGITIRDNKVDGQTGSSYPVIYIYAYDFETPNVNLNNLVIQNNTITTQVSTNHLYIRNIGTGTVTNVHVNNNSLLNFRAIVADANTIDAENNWWGASSGPSDPNDEPGEEVEVPPCDDVNGLAMMNVDGTGGTVKGNVDYCPWNSLPLETMLSVPADGSLLSADITQLKVTFNKDVKNDGSASAANNVTNYLLFEDGANSVFDTVNCLGSIATDDTNIVINTVTYNPAIYTSTLNVNGGVALPAGNYRLLVCGTTSVEDLDGNKLNSGIADSIFTFTVVSHADTVEAETIPATGFAPYRNTFLPEQTFSYTQNGLWLEIPKLGIQMDIVGVPQANGEWDVTWLGTDAGWLEGSAFPTLTGNSVLTGHVWNADNTAGPFRNIDSLWYGDKVIVHAWDEDYIYEVRSVSQVKPYNTAAMLKHEDLAWLTLVTCRNYDENTDEYKHRILVRAVLIEVK